LAVRLAIDRAIARASNGHAEAIPAAAVFRVDVARQHGAVRVCPVSEVDIATIEQLRARIDEAMAAGARRVILDLRQTTFFDSAGLHAAMEADRWAARTGTEFAIIAGPPAVQRTFELAGLSERLPFVDMPPG
jgi:anti-anti-sigma factor